MQNDLSMNHKMEAAEVIEKATKAAEIATTILREHNTAFQKSPEDKPLAYEPDYEKIRFRLTSIFVSILGKRKAIVPNP